jgi:hypothetical protein
VKKIDGRTVAGRKLAAAARAANGTGRKPGRPPRAAAPSPVVAKPARKPRKPRTPAIELETPIPVAAEPVKKTRGRKKIVHEALPPPVTTSEDEAGSSEHDEV